ncbi:MAG: AraC family transcriptional regulator [Desulfovibrio sp.]|nr:AraC family transcriptional regulator [Desulfovibrio sp.]
MIKELKPSANLSQGMLEQILSVMPMLAPAPGQHGALDGLLIYRRDKPTASTHCFDWPMAALTVQGAKVIQSGERRFELGQGTLLIICVDMPSVSSLIKASTTEPFYSLAIRLDQQILADEINCDPLPQATQCLSAWAEQADLEYLDIFRRAAALALRPERNALLFPLLKRELHLLLLADPRSALLRSLYWRNGSRINEVIKWLRENITAPAPMEYLARMANMSVSSFHRHFKDITGSSPLQYIKKLRLYEARRRMLADDKSASEAALLVGYESITQFNREYRRMFGEPPGRDIQQLKRVTASPP